MHLYADKCAYFEKNVFFFRIVVVDQWHTTGGAKRSLEALPDGQGADVGKGGRESGRETGFSHLDPDNSTQVVDFPDMYDVSIFSRDGKCHGTGESAPDA